MTRMPRQFEVSVSGSDLNVTVEIQFTLVGLAHLLRDEPDSMEVRQAIHDNVRFLALRVMMEMMSDSKKD